MYEIMFLSRYMIIDEKCDIKSSAYFDVNFNSNRSAHMLLYFVIH